MNPEPHPLEPFLPERARLLMLGSFPPPRKRWSMEFYYPNLQNDMWRIFGVIFFNDRNRFLAPDGRSFDRQSIEAFCREKGVALYDTARAVRRLKENASDEFLEIVEPTDIEALLRRLPECREIVTTGGKAAAAAAASLHCNTPGVGEFVAVHVDGRTLRLWRMPSSSRAYPLALDRKAEAYRRVLATLSGDVPAP